MVHQEEKTAIAVNSIEKSNEVTISRTQKRQRVEEMDENDMEHN